MLSMVLLLLLAWMVLSVLIAALFSVVIRHCSAATHDWDRALADHLRLRNGLLLMEAGTAPGSSQGSGFSRASSPRRT